MGRKYQIRDQTKLYFVTFTIVDWLNIFDIPDHCLIFLDSVKFCQLNKGLEVYAWCIMPNHLHMIIGTSGVKTIQDIIRDLKSFTSRQIRINLENLSIHSVKADQFFRHLKKVGMGNSRNNDFQLWQQHYHPVELSSNKMMDQRLEYIHENPVKAGLAKVPEQWKWSSAVDYYGVGKGLLEIIFLE